jgi:hypothetical protein
LAFLEPVFTSFFRWSRQLLNFPLETLERDTVIGSCGFGMLSCCRLLEMSVLKYHVGMVVLAQTELDDLRGRRAFVDIFNWRKRQNYQKRSLLGIVSFIDDFRLDSKPCTSVKGSKG